ncbi:MAG: hypothetical protein R3282_08570 [Rhodothermales bacterium]|nr:hypothetical protein [Rhodothermales bacterium]
MREGFGYTALRLGRELAVVFLGVLIALAVDAWWTGVQSRAELEGYLAGVAADLEGTLESLDELIEIERTRQVELEGAIRLLASSEPISDTVVFTGFQSSAPVLPLRTLNALLDNTDLTLLRPELRHQLAEFQAGAEDLRNTFLRHEDQQAALVTEAVMEADRLGAVGPDALRDRPSIAAMRQSPRFLGVARSYYVVRLNHLAALARLRRAIEELSAVLNEQAAGAA